MPAASLVEALLGSTVASLGQDAGNRVALEGVTVGPGQDGAVAVGIHKLEATSLRIAAGPLVLEIGHVVLHELVALVRLQDGVPRLGALAAASAELPAVKVQGPLAGAVADGAWSLAPLAGADGSIGADIADAHLLFDARVTVPIRRGQVDFNDASVEHVGPDSRMGVGQEGLYVDAPNGRSYLYRFPAGPVAGVAYERRNAMLGPWVSDRGQLRLQEFAEGLLRAAAPGPGLGFTEQARPLFERTSIAGELRLGDGPVAAPGLQAELAGSADGRNAVRLHSEAVGRGLTLELPSLALRHVAAGAGGCDALTGALTLRLAVDGAQWRFELALSDVKLTGLRLAA